jgi:hypothetical protein
MGARRSPPASPRRPASAGLLTAPLGYALLVVGGALLVLPGPGIPLVLGGLALLARDRPWARRAHRGLMRRVARVRRRLVADRG